MADTLQVRFLDLARSGGGRRTYSDFEQSTQITDNYRPCILIHSRSNRTSRDITADERLIPHVPGLDHELGIGTCAAVLVQGGVREPSVVFDLPNNAREASLDSDTDHNQIRVKFLGCTH